MRTLYGGSGHVNLNLGEAVLNDTDKEFEVHYSYSTVANGSASCVAIKPGEVAWLRSSGGASDFARWDVGSPDELPSDVRVRLLTTQWYRE